MKKIVFLVLSIVALLPLFACTQTVVQAGELKSDKPRLTPPANQADRAGLVDGNNTFAWNLYRKVKDGDGNLFFSPYSISQALAMTYGGARTQTEKQMADVLQFKLGQNSLHPAFNSLDLELAKRGQGAKGKDEKGFRLHIINAIWGQKDFKFKADYLDLLAQNYGAGLRLVDFIKATEEARLSINNWASDQTEGKIKDLLPQGSINTLTRLVLTNAIYFNAAWQSQFRKENTGDADFTLLNGRRVVVPMMNQQKFLGYTEGSDYQAVELPYDGKELSMVVILPKADTFKTFENALTSQQITSLLQDLKNSQVDLSMPRFTFSADFSLKKALSEMGMTDAFIDTRADFSGMDGAKDLVIKDVIHKAFVAVDEAGTEAAAVTAVIVGVTAMPVEVKQVTLDHPFIFLIRDIQTNSILFIGRVMNP